MDRQQRSKLWQIGGCTPALFVSILLSLAAIKSCCGNCISSKRWQSSNGGLVEGEGGYYSRRGGSRMNYKQKGDGIEGRHCCPTLPPLANEGWDPGWPWDLMLDTGWLEGGDMSLLERVSAVRRKGSCTVNKDRGGFLLENFAKCA